MKRASLRDLSERVGAAQRALAKAVHERVKPGDRVHVRWGDNEVPADVVRVLEHWPRVQVNSIHGKTYVVDAYRLVEFDYL